MRWSRRRHAKARRQVRRVIAMYVQASHDANYTALALLEKLAPLLAAATAHGAEWERIAHTLEAEVARVVRERDEASRLLGTVVVASTLRPGESLPHASGHAAVTAMLCMVADLHAARAEVEALKAELVAHQSESLRVFELMRSGRDAAQASERRLKEALETLAWKADRWRVSADDDEERQDATAQARRVVASPPPTPALPPKGAEGAPEAIPLPPCIICGAEADYVVDGTARCDAHRRNGCPPTPPAETKETAGEAKGAGR